MRLSGAASGPVYDLRFFCRDDPVRRLAQDLERIRGGDLRNGQNLPRTERRIRRCQRLLVDILRRHLLAVDQDDAVRREVRAVDGQAAVAAAHTGERDLVDAEVQLHRLHRHLPARCIVLAI